jgi:hypothetical protein
MIFVIVKGEWQIIPGLTRLGYSSVTWINMQTSVADEIKEVVLRETPNNLWCLAI